MEHERPSTPLHAEQPCPPDQLVLRPAYARMVAAPRRLTSGPLPSAGVQPRGDVRVFTSADLAGLELDLTQ
jgi:hypothetical protein